MPPALSTPSTPNTSCELCTTPGGVLIWQDEHCRVVRVGGTEGHDYPGFCRVIWHAHVREMSDLGMAARQHLMNVVLATEATLRTLYQPEKINLASLGNLTPHLHWHVIPRQRHDPCFPAPIWAPPRRPATAQNMSPDITTDHLRSTLIQHLQHLQPQDAT